MGTEIKTEEAKWAPTPNTICEMRVEVGGHEHWVPVEVQSYSVPDSNPFAGNNPEDDNPEDTTFVRTWPGQAWSAIWVPTSALQRAVV